MKRITGYKTCDVDHWRAVPVPHSVDLNRTPVSVISGKKYMFVAGVSVRSVRFDDGSEYHVDTGWN